MRRRLILILVALAALAGAAAGGIAYERAQNPPSIVAEDSLDGWNDGH